MRCEELGWTRRDLEPLIGSRARVSEILSGRRALTLPMIRRINEKLGIPAEVLIAENRATFAALRRAVTSNLARSALVAPRGAPPNIALHLTVGFACARPPAGERGRRWAVNLRDALARTRARDAGSAGRLRVIGERDQFHRMHLFGYWLLLGQLVAHAGGSTRRLHDSKPTPSCASHDDAAADDAAAACRRPVACSTAHASA